MFKRTILALSCFLVAGQAFAQNAEQDATKNAAFSSVTSQAFPLTPQQIDAVRQLISERQKASSAVPGTSDQQSSSRTLTVSLDPSKRFVPPVIRIGVGMITSVVFTDANGKVWPITQYSIGDSQSFNVMWQKKGGVLMVQGMKPFKESNIAVMLQGLQIPVMVTLVTGQKNWDYLDYVRVQAALGGKDQSAQSVQQAPPYLTSLLSGLPPKGAVQMQVSGGNDVQVWKYSGNYLILTPATLVSPAWSAKAQDNGMVKMNAYEIAPTPYLLLSNNDQVERITITGEGVGS